MRHLYYFILLLTLPCVAQSQKPEFDIVLKNGRVIDPETGLDEVRNVGIRGNRIVEISSNALTGKEVIDVSNLVVSPGFIDIHAHGQTNKENEFQAHDGVTTALELEVGRPNIGGWLASRKDNAVLNYGASVAHQWVREEIMTQSSDKAGPEGLPKDNTKLSDRSSYKSNYLPLKKELMQASLDLIDLELQAGAMGIGVSIGYYPGATREEIFNVYEFAALRKALLVTHVREGRALAIQQAIADAAVNGTSLHIVHINSMAMDEISLAIRMVGHAQQHGMDITTELYPYPASSTFLQPDRNLDCAHDTSPSPYPAAGPGGRRPTRSCSCRGRRNSSRTSFATRRGRTCSARGPCPSCSAGQFH